MKTFILLALMFSISLSLKAQKDTINTPHIKLIKDSLNYTKIDTMPDYIGGNDALIKFLSSNIKYPRKAANHGIEGTVYIRFVVSRDGSIIDAKVVKSVNLLLDNEALRVISIMPKWKPGYKNGVPVPVFFVVPVIFSLQQVINFINQIYYFSTLPILCSAFPTHAFSYSILF